MCRKLSLLYTHILTCVLTRCARILFPDSTKQGLIATRLSVLEALVIKVDENIHPWYYVAENIHPWLLQHMCTVDSVQCSVGVLKEPDRPGQICASQWGINSKIREKEKK